MGTRGRAGCRRQHPQRCSWAGHSRADQAALMDHRDRRRPRSRRCDHSPAGTEPKYLAGGGVTRLRSRPRCPRRSPSSSRRFPSAVRGEVWHETGNLRPAALVSSSTPVASLGNGQQFRVRRGSGSRNADHELLTTGLQGALLLTKTFLRSRKLNVIPTVGGPRRMRDHASSGKATYLASAPSAQEIPTGWIPLNENLIIHPAH